MARSREWKYVLHQNGEEELYDLRADAAELHNVADAPTAATAKARLASALRAHLQATGDPFAPAVNPGR
jgi:arylsulfatase A-like enzyme